MDTVGGKWAIYSEANYCNISLIALGKIRYYDYITQKLNEKEKSIYIVF